MTRVFPALLAVLLALPAAAQRLPDVVILATGGTNIEGDDDAPGFVASCELNPQKARVLLRLALLETQAPDEIQRIFAEY